MFVAYPWYEFPTISNAATDAIVRWAFGNADAVADEVEKLYPRALGYNANMRLEEIIQDAVFICSTRRAAITRANQGLPSYVSETAFQPFRTQDLLGKGGMKAKLAGMMLG